MAQVGIYSWWNQVYGQIVRDAAASPLIKLLLINQIELTLNLKMSTDAIKMESILSNSLYIGNVRYLTIFRFEMASSRLQWFNSCLAQ